MPVPPQGVVVCRRFGRRRVVAGWSLGQQWPTRSPRAARAIGLRPGSRTIWQTVPGTRRSTSSTWPEVGPGPPNGPS
eukprot:8415349-Lingulodinium_polyedra.AAC.1